VEFFYAIHKVTNFFFHLISFNAFSNLTTLCGILWDLPASLCAVQWTKLKLVMQSKICLFFFFRKYHLSKHEEIKKNAYTFLKRNSMSWSNIFGKEKKIGISIIKKTKNHMFSIGIIFCFSFIIFEQCWWYISINQMIHILYFFFNVLSCIFIITSHTTNQPSNLQKIPTKSNNNKPKTLNVCSYFISNTKPKPKNKKHWWKYFPFE
jgi:hypothetical protein